MTEEPTSSDRIKVKLFFAPYSDQPMINDITISNTERLINFSSKKQIISIGTFESNDVVIDERMVSRRHLVIMQEFKE